MPHLACFCTQSRAKGCKMGTNCRFLPPAFLRITPCENELFAADGQFMAREGSHNVKICADNFT